MNIDYAENILNEYRTRENAVLADDVVTWDKAYEVAYNVYLSERDFKVK